MGFKVVGKSVVAVALFAMAGVAGAAEMSTMSGVVTGVEAKGFELKSGGKQVRFETEAPTRGVREGDRVEVKYVLEAKSVKLRDRGQQAGRAAPKKRVIIDDRAFFPA